MIQNFKEQVLKFLDHQKGKQPGFFRLSYSGDLYDEGVKWGLGASAFAAKIYQMLGALGSLDEKYRKDWINFIKIFANENGEIFDPLVNRRAALRSKISAIRTGYLKNFFNQEIKRAETKQSWATLQILGAKPEHIYAGLPQTEAEIEKYIRKLNWAKNPWNAASHIAHLLFFFSREEQWFKKNRQREIVFIIKQLEALQAADGSWHKNFQLPNYNRVNAAMKIITGLVAASKPTFPNPEKLIDLCLAEKFDAESCSRVDRIYVLYWASQLTGYRRAEIKAFAEKKLKQYEENFRPEGGFSFYKDAAQHYYYGAILTRGLNEPDMHGTVLGVWGYVMLLKMLDFPEAKEFYLPTV